MPAPDTRQRLIHAAADLLLRKGYQASGVDEICRLAAAQKGSFYHFFPTKTDLALAALAFTWSEVRHEVFDVADQSGPGGLDRLRRLIDALDAFHRRQWTNRGVLGSPIGGLAQEMTRDDRIQSAVREIFDLQRASIVRWLDEATRARQITVGDNHARSRDILALIEGALMASRVAGEPAVFGEICAAIPTLAGRAPGSSRPSPATAPELA